MLGNNKLTTVAIATIVVTVTIVITRRKNKKGDEKLLPKSKAGIFLTIRELAGSRTPYFLLDQARSIGSNNYRLALPIPAVVIGDAKLARSILSNPKNDKPLEMLNSFEITLGGTCMFTQPNEQAKITKKLTSRAFAPDEVRGRMNSICHRRIKDWIRTVLKPAIEAGSLIDPCREMMDVAFRIVCEAVFEYEATREECELFLKHGNVTATEFGFKQMMNPLRPILGNWLAERAKAYESVEWIQQFGLKMLREFQLKKKEGRNAKDCNTVINLLDSDPRYKSNEEKLPELLLWLFAGHDTVGLSIGIALWHLAQNPSEMVKVRNAINNVSDESERHNVKEVQNVIKESNRLLSVAANISMRKLGQDITTPDGFFIPKGTTAFLPQFLPNHDPHIYNNPDLFLPSRWDDATKEMLDAHMPFAVGPRSCPGLALAKEEMNEVLPKLIADYDFEVVEKGEPKFFITYKIVGALLLPKYVS